MSRTARNQTAPASALAAITTAAGIAIALLHTRLRRAEQRIDSHDEAHVRFDAHIGQFEFEGHEPAPVRDIRSGRRITGR